MRIHSLTMKDFRGFEDATLDLDRPLTVLFGVNGSGKSSVLVAIAVVLFPPADLRRALAQCREPDARGNLPPFAGAPEYWLRRRLGDQAA
jgi:DNA repair exonuclease SbcCD ATPase subunit